MSPLAPLLSLDFRKRFALWSRLEPRCRSSNFAEGLAARVGDPLWMIARQWQFGEFAAMDGGSPVRADLDYRTTPLTHVQLGTGPVTALDASAPLETMVEREQITFKLQDGGLAEYRMRVRAGQRLERELKRAGGTNADALVRAFRKRYPIRLQQGAARSDVDRATRRYVSLMVGRVTDGIDVLTAIGSNPAPIATIISTAIDPSGSLTNAVLAALNVLRTWYTQLFAQPATANPAWMPDRLAYTFNVRAVEGAETTTEATTLSAPQYRNGELDWHSMSLVKAPKPVESTRSTFLPTGLTFAGMPNRRWWAFEDARVDLGNLDASTTEVAKLALVEFALIYADDWFMYPLVVPAGSVTRIVGLTVTDTFGRARVIPRGITEGTSPWNRWEMFTLSQPANTPAKQYVLFVPPATGFREESEPLEVVRFARDEGANKVWGIERTVTNALGDGVGGPGAHRERLELEREDKRETSNGAVVSDPLTDAEAALIRYKIQTYVPYNWIPFAPVRANDDGTSIRLHRARMLLNEDSRAPEPIPGLSTLLMGPGGPRVLNEEAVLRSGLSVQLTRQRVRWIDGKTYVWLGRGVKIGQGEASSGLRFDVVVDPATTQR